MSENPIAQKVDQDVNITALKYINSESALERFREVLGEKAPSFIASVLSVVKDSDALSKAEPTSVFMSAMVAASLDLPINKNLGFAYIVPYNTKIDNKRVKVAQFQMGYKGFIQLALRSGQFKKLSVTKVLDGQIIKNDPLMGYEFDRSVKGGDVAGYAAYFKLNTGFEKFLYMTVEELQEHGKEFSKSYDKDNSLWKNKFEAMAEKTVLKLLLSKFAPLSIDMQTAVLADQGVIKDADTLDVEYPDNSPSIDVATEGFEPLSDNEKADGELRTEDQVTNNGQQSEGVQ